MTRALLLLLALSLGVMAGCKKQQRAKDAAPSTTGEAPPAEIPPAASSSQPLTPTRLVEKLRGASIVRDDLKKKDYARAVEGLLALRAYAVSQEHRMEHRELSSEVVQALAAAAPTDPNAAKALTAYNVTMYGR